MEIKAKIPTIIIVFIGIIFSWIMIRSFIFQEYALNKYKIKNVKSRIVLLKDINSNISPIITKKYNKNTFILVEFEKEFYSDYTVKKPWSIHYKPNGFSGYDRKINSLKFKLNNNLTNLNLCNVDTDTSYFTYKIGNKYISGEFCDNVQDFIHKYNSNYFGDEGEEKFSLLFCLDSNFVNNIKFKNLNVEIR